MKELYDNTKLTCQAECARKYYFRHERNWEPEGTKAALAFGAAWHAAMDVVWVMIDKSAYAGNPMQVAEESYEAWIGKWCEEGMLHPDDLGPEELDDLGARTPGTALEMLYAYVDKRADYIHSVELLAVEKPFVVRLSTEDDTLFYMGRIDKVVRDGGRIKGIEHKTTSAYSKAMVFRSQFLESFSPNRQIDGYLFGGRMLYGEEFDEIRVDAALVHRNVHDGFTFIPVRRQTAQLDAWLWETHQRIDEIRQNRAAAQASSPDDPYMAAWPKNTNSCWNFNSACPYLDLCKSWSNPKGKDLPLGFVESPWSPLDHLPTESVREAEEKMVTGEEYVPVDPTAQG